LYLFVNYFFPLIKKYLNLIIFIKNIFKLFILNVYWGLGIGDLGLGIGEWGLGPIPNPQSPIPNPQSPSPIFIIKYIYILKINKNFLLYKLID